MDFWIKAAQLILSLSILIVLHELGHFIPAKLFKTKVEKFYLFFNPWFSLFKVKKGETEYGLGWLPLGGYVKIAGMIDESMDKEQLAKPAEPWEFRAKPAWQRLIIMIGGVTVNIILGFLIYIMVLWVWGTDSLPLKNVKYGIVCDSVLIDNGLMNGDKIVSIEGKVPEDLMSINKQILLRGKRKLVVERDGKNIPVNLPVDIDYKMVGAGAKSAIGPRVPTIMDSLFSDMPAIKAGFQKGDSVITLNGEPAGMYDLFIYKMSKIKKGSSVAIAVSRNGEEMTINVKTDKDGKVGFQPVDLDKTLKFVHKDYSLGEAIPAGFSFATQTLGNYVTSLKFLFTKEGASQIGGFGSMGSLFSAEWDWHSFWMLTAFLSIVLAFMNILPIPALDGGHVLFLIWEMITGRAANQKVLEYAQMVGMVLLLGLLIYANGNDILKLFS